MIRQSASILILSVALTAFAQELPRTAVSETIEVQLTNLDVIVTDAQGNHVPGLTSADFEILEDGRRREITNLAEYRRTQIEVGQPVPRRILVVIDNRTIAFSARNKTVSAMLTAVDRLLSSPDDRLMVVTIAGVPKARTPWTNDRAAIAAALADVTNDAAASRLETAEIENMFGEMIQVASGGLSAVSMARRRGRSATGGSNPGSRVNGPSDEDERSLPGVDFNLILSRTRSYAASVAAETEQTLYSLSSSLAQFNNVSEGRRIVLLAGGSLPVLPGADVYQRLESAVREIERHQNTALPVGQMRRVSHAIMEKATFDLGRQFDEVASAARLKGIAFYAVNPEVTDYSTRNISARYSAGAATDFASGNSSTDGFLRLALATGGESHVGRTADLALTKLTRDLDAYYSVGYRSPILVGPDTKIAVKMKNGYRARAVISAARTKPEWQIADRVVNNYASSDTNDLGIILIPDGRVSAKPTGERQVKVNVMIPFDALRLVRDGRDYNCSFTVFVSVGDANGGANPQRETRYFKFNEEQVTRLRGKNLAYGVDLTLAPGRDRVSVGILDLVGGSTGYGRMLFVQ
ncbi:MAG TPA: VWA domain-containing protein [Thermoanaerobaculia bacterium]|jgi:VWFA-related protein|nr:VWA domain-containing protein [Thermoanaerobaculia bacterium]